MNLSAAALWDKEIRQAPGLERAWGADTAQGPAFRINGTMVSRLPAAGITVCSRTIVAIRSPGTTVPISPRQASL